MGTSATRRRSWTCGCALVVAALLHLAAPAPATAQATLSNGWEDGTTQGWVPRGSVTLTNTTELAVEGTHSLKTTGRTATWMGPSLDLLPLLTPGTIYQFRIRARLVAGQPATQLKLTMQGTTRDGDTYTQLAATGATGATDSAWVTLQGTYNVPFCLTKLILYVESASATASFYVDEFSASVINLVSCSDTTGLHADFETGTTQGWGPRGSATVAVTTADYHSGGYSLLTTNRGAAWQGPAVDVGGKMCTGSRYSVSVWVKLAPAQTDSQIRVSLQRNIGSDATYSTVLGNKLVTSGAWVQFSGPYDFSTGYTALQLYVESNSGTSSFYIDDFDLAFVQLLPAPPPVPPPYCPPGPPIATGLDQFLGCAYSNSQKVNFTAYWNQVTPENGGKWGSVESTRNTMVWTEMDAAYKLAKDNHFPVKFHTLVWGNQQPSWIGGLMPSDQLAEINQWFGAVAARYPDLDQIDVVNEPLHAPPPYVEALGGAGTSGWDWVLTAFRMARTYFPHAQLLINEYSVTNSTTDMNRYIGIITLLQNENLIDGVGVQGHYFSTKSYSGDLPATSAQQKANLDLLAETGLPIYVTEMDIDGPTDELQLSEYQRIFPIFWEHPGVKGVTLWGYRTGMWRANAFLAYDNGAERPAFVWLQNYVEDKRPVVAGAQSFRIDAGTCNVIGRLAGSDPDEATRPELAVLQGWKIVGGSGAGLFAIDPATGSLTVAKPLEIDFGRTGYEVAVTVGDGFKTSEPQTVTITIPDKIGVVHNGSAISVAKEAVPAHLREHADCLGILGVR